MSAASMDTVSKLSNLLPTGTFLAFQAVAPLFTNNGECGGTEKIMTAILLVTFGVICSVLNFTDSLTTSSGKVYYGIVTTKGLFSPQFKGSGILGVKEGSYLYDDEEHKYRVNTFDFVNGVLDIVVFGTLTLLTPPITTCYYPRISNTIVKTVPILVALVVAAYFSFAPTPRHGLGFSSPSAKIETGEKNVADPKTESLLNSDGLSQSRDHRTIKVSSPGRTTV